MGKTIYPYYKITILDSGVLRTWGQDTKFHSLEEAEAGLKRRLEVLKMRDPGRVPDEQVVILRYAKNYTCEVIKLIDYQRQVIIDLL